MFLSQPSDADYSLDLQGASISTSFEDLLILSSQIDFFHCRGPSGAHG